MEFTEDELKLLKLIFNVADTIVESQREGNYDVYNSNLLYSIKEKLGIYDILEGQGLIPILLFILFYSHMNNIRKEVMQCPMYLAF